MGRSSKRAAQSVTVGGLFQLGRGSGTGQHSRPAPVCVTVGGFATNFSIGGPGAGTVPPPTSTARAPHQNNAASVVTVTGGDFLIGTTSSTR